MTILSVAHLHKSFALYDTPIARIKAALLGRQSSHRYHALQDISFSLLAGESVAILGRNGAGKSTLLKLITGVLLPDSGELHHAGRITGLLELGTGFDHALTGRENIKINGILLGITEYELLHLADQIIAFSELDAFIDQPVRTYSSGMIMRLGFSIAIHANPACLIVDEALAVGDARFQQKCLDWMRRFQQRGGALLFVSHDLAAIKQLCQRAMVLDQGKLVYEGDALSACNYYETSLVEVKVKMMKQSDGLVQLLACRWLDHEGQEIMPITGQYIELSIELALSETLQDMSLGFMIRDRLGQDLMGSNTQLLANSPIMWSAGRLEVRFPMIMNLMSGEYVLFIALHDAMDYTKNVQLWQQTAENFTVVSSDSQMSVGQVYCALQPPFWRHLS